METYSNYENGNPSGQNTGKFLLELFNQFVKAVTTETMADMLEMPEFHKILEELCRKAPEPSRSLAFGIVDHTTHKDIFQDLQLISAKSALRRNHRKKTLVEDLSYKPNSSHKISSTDDSVNNGAPSVTQNATLDTLTKENEGSDDGSIDEHSEHLKWMLDHVIQEREQNDNRENPIGVSTEASTGSGVNEAPSSADTKETIQETQQLLAEETLDSYQSPHKGPPCTPAQQFIQRPMSPPSSHKGESSATLITADPFTSTSASISISVISTSTMVMEAVQTIYGFHKYSEGLPRQVHSHILQSLQEHERDPNVRRSNYSDGTLWVRILAAGDSENAKSTAFRMLEFMGAWSWYDKQVKLAQGTVLTKKGKSVDRKGAANHVLNNIAIEMTQRKRITTQLTRGRKLCEILVKELGVGVLLIAKIWAYTKMSDSELWTVVHALKEDPKRTELLQLLSQQLRLLIDNGLPDLQSLLESLLSKGLISEDEHRNVTAKVSDIAATISLDSVVDELTEQINTSVLGKRKFQDDVTVAIANGTEWSRHMLDLLRQDQWFDAWTVKALMEICDRFDFVRIGYSVPLDQYARNSRLVPVRKPFAAWRRKVDEASGVYRSQLPDGKGLIHLCPVNSRDTHYTLLEINEREKMIYHYDSMANQNVIEGAAAPTRLEKLVKEEFKYLHFSYMEVPTPQQRDSSSCGPMVVRNAGHRMMGLPVGGWSDMVNPQQLRLEFARKLQSSVDFGAMRPKRFRVGEVEV